MLIGFTGKAGVGKDTAFGFIKEVYPEAQRFAFADPIRNAVQAAFPYIDFSKLSKEDMIPQLGVTVRYLYQTLGTEWGRDIIGPNCWILGLEEAYKLSDMLVVTDVRFDNEAREIQRLGGVIVQILRPDATRLTHRSELGVRFDYIEHVVINHDTPEVFRNNILGAIKCIST